MLLALLAVAPAVQSADQRANPIRKVVTLLQNMQKKVTAEGEKEQKIYDKFMCYCKTSGGDLAKSIAESNAKTSALPAAIEEAEAKKNQLQADLKAHQTDRAAAKQALAAAQAIREKEA